MNTLQAFLRFDWIPDVFFSPGSGDIHSSLLSSSSSDFANTHALSGHSHDGTLLFCFGLQLGDRRRGLLLQLVHVHVLQVLNLTQEGVFAFLLCSVLIHHLEQLLGHVHVIPGHLDHVLILLALHVTTSEQRARSESRNIGALRWKLIYKTSWIMTRQQSLHFYILCWILTKRIEQAF